MNIIIIGDGKVGYTLAERLSGEAHNITIIDRNAEALKRATENLDVLCIHGNGSSLRILADAGVASADLVIAVTTNDEMNMLCCVSAKKLGAKYTVARIRDPEYFNEIRQLKQQLDINLVINPERSTATEILRLLRFPSADIIDTFSRGQVELIGFTVAATDSIVGMSLAQMGQHVKAAVRLCVIERGQEIMIPKGDTVIAEGDLVCVIGSLLGITKFFKEIGRKAAQIHDVMIVGGGRIGYYLAQDAAQMGIKPYLIESDAAICDLLAEALPDTTIICGDGTEQDVLESENIDKMDSFVSLMGRDEENLMVALYAMQRGVRKVIAKSNRSNYNSVVKDLGIHSVVSPKEITANQILHFVRGLQNSQGSAVETLYSLLDGRVEALEFKVDKDTLHLGEKVRTLPLKKGLLLGVIYRAGASIVPEGDDHLQEGDNVVVVTRMLGFSSLNEIFEG